MTLSVRVNSITAETQSVNSYELHPVDGTTLPQFTAGSHIDLRLGNGLIRSYSLINSQTERDRYVIAAQKDRNTRGGSKWLHEHVKSNDIIQIEEPRNNFGLNESAECSLLIAGGIGITPFISMIDRLSAIKRDWRLIYCSRKRSDTAFLRRLEKIPSVRFNFDEEPGGEMLDIAAIIRETPSNTHFYCCGPLSMLSAFEQATESVEPARVHIEYFTAKEAPARQGGFRVVLDKSKQEFFVPEGKTILEVLRDNGVGVSFLCTEGMCGTCETQIIEGVPDHRDSVLTEQERASNKTMMICCSGAKSEKLILDL